MKKLIAVLFVLVLVGAVWAQNKKPVYFQTYPPGTEGDYCSLQYWDGPVIVKDDSTNTGQNTWYCNPTDGLWDLIAPGTATDRTGWYILSDDLNTLAELNAQIADETLVPQTDGTFKGTTTFQDADGSTTFALVCSGTTCTLTLDGAGAGENITIDNNDGALTLQGCRLPQVCADINQRIDLITTILRVGPGNDADAVANVDFQILFENFDESYTLLWDESEDKFVLSEALEVENLVSAGNVIAGTNKAYLEPAGTIQLAEVAAPSAAAAGLGRVYVKNDTPNTLYFQDDAGSTVQLGAGGGSQCIDNDADSNCEVDSVIADEIVVYDFDDDGQVDRRLYKEAVTSRYFASGTVSPSQLVALEGSVSHYGAFGSPYIRSSIQITSAASANANAIFGLGSVGSTSTGNGAISSTPFRECRFAITENTSGTDWRYLGGVWNTATSRDFLKVDEGNYFMCAPVDDVDGDGSAGSTNDLYWWAVSSDGDTDHTGDICATLTGAQCATYTATNTEATNTEISCDGNYELYDMRIEVEADQSEARFYMDEVLVATHTTNITNSNLWADWGAAGETTTSTAFKLLVTAVEYTRVYD